MLWLVLSIWLVLAMSTPNLVAVHFFPLIAVAAAMGKAEDNASIVALVPFSAEEGKGVCRAGAGK